MFKWLFQTGDEVVDKHTGKPVGKVKGFESDGSRVVVQTPTGIRKWFGGNLERSGKEGKK